MIERDYADGDREKDESYEGMGEKQKRFATHVADGLVLRDVSKAGHGYPSKGYRK